VSAGIIGETADWRNSMSDVRKIGHACGFALLLGAALAAADARAQGYAQYWCDAAGNCWAVAEPDPGYAPEPYYDPYYQQNDGVGENYGDGGSSYYNSTTGEGVITDGQGGVWVSPDPGGY
jgi:hypothetical protein